MATDIARVSYDAGRHYIGVVAQQGRVTLEAEQNEQRAIDAAGRRHELLEIVGPVGTPDNGYAITAAAGRDFGIGPGTMYVGGARVWLDQGITYSDQPDWLDHADDPDWTPSGDEAGGNEHVVLVVQEQEVTAVEDQALYEVALGGPDGAARTRLAQHVYRLPTKASDCAGALAQDAARWAAQGLRLDPATMRLEPASRLLVTWAGPPAPPQPCEPGSTGGYLGAENQVIRVRLTQVRADGTFDLVWGYDNASFLYRVSAGPGATPELRLERSPVDDFHRPRAGQAVEVLPAATKLYSSDGALEAYAAAPAGLVGVLPAPYDPDAKAVQFPVALPAAYAASPQLFLRVWEEQLTGNQPGTAIELTGTGMQVTITADGGGPLHAGDYWCIGTRPSTSTEVYPLRYLRAPQPPDGPASWVCPLAVIGWKDGSLLLIEDCRRHFVPLVDVEASGCCTVEARPSDVHDGRLQRLIDAAAANRAVKDRADRVTVCLQPGRYELEAPIVLTARHSNLILRGCSDGAVIAAAPGRERRFGQGLIVLVEANNITITGLELELPQVPAVLGNVRGHAPDRPLASALNALAANRYVSVGIRPVHCAVLAITGCLFRFSVGGHVTTPEVEQTMPRTVFGVGVFAADVCWGLELTGNRFLHEPALAPVSEDGPVHVLAGYLLAPILVSRPTHDGANRSFDGSLLEALLHDAVVRDNIFDGISMAMLVAADLGTIKIRDNTVRRCQAGVYLLDLTSAVYLALARSLTGAAPVGVADPVLVLLLVGAITFPLPAGAAPAAAPAARRALPVAEFGRMRARWEEGFTAVTGWAPGAAPAPATATRPQLAIEPALERAGTRLAAAVRAAAAKLNDSHLKLHVDQNDIDTGDERSGTSALLVFLSRDDSEQAVIPGTYVIAAANRIASASVAGAAVLLSGASDQAVNANYIGTEGRRSLIMGVTANVAVTGNVFKGTATLPAGRPFPPPLDTWLPLNTVV
jgi:hypothetical protein